MRFQENYQKCKNHTAKLTEYRCNSCSRNTEFRERTYTENQERVKNNINYRSRELKQHWENHIARSLQSFFDCNFYNRKE